MPKFDLKEYLMEK